VTADQHGLKVCPMHGMRFDRSGKGVPYALGQREGDGPKPHSCEEKLWRDG